MSPMTDSSWTKAFGSRFDTRAIRLAGVAHDASHIERVPQAFLIAKDADDVAAAMGLANRLHNEITFRAGGSSLSGQAGSEGVLVDVRRAFRQVDVLDNGARVACGPGVTVNMVNAHLAPYGTMLGPDPASSIAATIGGVVANNSSGMACGTEFNTYRTLESLRVVLASGTVVDTASPDADALLREKEPKLYKGLLDLRERVRSNLHSMAVIAHQYSMKNTMGYGLNSFTDFDSPVKILEHLMVGSEGTLGFIAKAVFRTVPILPNIATSLMIFPELTAATDALPALLEAGASTLELMDPASIRSVQPYIADDDPMKGVGGGDGDKTTALLVELRADGTDALAGYVATMGALLPTLPLTRPGVFTQDAAQRGKLWHARNGLYTIVAGQRPAGATALLEDVAVPMAELSSACGGLDGLFTQHGYAESVIFGHAKDGNIHFMVTLHTDQGEELKRFERFNNDMVSLILDHHGTLKAEHGTGRIMTPFVRRQYGDELYDVMCRVKQLFDPNNILNPGTIINDDERAHMRNIKITPTVDPAFDRCVACGFCEPVCPPRDLTLTARQRLAIVRTMALSSDTVRAELAHDFDYWGIDTCAADSMCFIACPVDIDTGKIMKRMRAERHSAFTQSAGLALAKHWGGAVTGLRSLLTTVDHVPSVVTDTASQAARTVLPKDWMPRAGRDLPGPGEERHAGQTIGQLAEVSVLTADPDKDTEPGRDGGA